VPRGLKSYLLLPTQRRDTDHRDVGEDTTRRAVWDNLLADEVRQRWFIFTDVLYYLLVDPRPDTPIHQRLNITDYLEFIHSVPFISWRTKNNYLPLDSLLSHWHFCQKLSTSVNVRQSCSVLHQCQKHNINNNINSNKLLNSVLFAQHSDSWPSGPLAIHHFWFLSFFVFNPRNLYYLGYKIIIIIINRFILHHKVATSEALGPDSVLVSRGRRESLGKEEYP